MYAYTFAWAEARYIYVWKYMKCATQPQYIYTKK